jgi:hypothetical protein
VTSAEARACGEDETAQRQVSAIVG